MINSNLMKLRDDIVIRKVGSEYITVVPSSQGVGYSSVVTLNESAAEVVKTFTGLEFSADLVATFLLNNYDVDTEKAHEDAVALVKLIESSGLISLENH